MRAGKTIRGRRARRRANRRWTLPDTTADQGLSIGTESSSPRRRTALPPWKRTGCRPPPNTAAWHNQELPQRTSSQRRGKENAKSLLNRPRLAVAPEKVDETFRPKCIGVVTTVEANTGHHSSLNGIKGFLVGRLTPKIESGLEVIPDNLPSPTSALDIMKHREQGPDEVGNRERTHARGIVEKRCDVIGPVWGMTSCLGTSARASSRMSKNTKHHQSPDLPHHLLGLRPKYSPAVQDSNEDIVALAANNELTVARLFFLPILGTVSDDLVFDRRDQMSGSSPKP